ncbi:MAG: hypothetical protein RL701_1870 [Pseudomonadota bacterium]|jgi:HEAT repeat protein
MHAKARVAFWSSLVVYLSCAQCAGTTPHAELVRAVEQGQHAAALEFYVKHGRDPALLREWSGDLLLHAARSEDASQSASAWTELALLGTRATVWLSRLERAGQAETPATASTRAQLVRARALQLRAALGHGDALSTLRDLLTSPDADVADLAYSTLDADDDWSLLESALQGPRATRRGIALRRLTQARTFTPAQVALLQNSARLDPAPNLRAAALFALERQGLAALPAFEAALHDPDEQVQAAALAGLGKLDAQRALAELDKQLGAAVSARGIAAAAALLHMRPVQEKDRAWAALQAALTSTDATLRARAAFTISTLDREPEQRALLRERLRTEPLASVKLALALALGKNEPDAITALVLLSQANSVAGVQAAAELAPSSEPARKHVRERLTSASPLVRATAVRLAAGLLNDPSALAPLLADATWQVRQAAAGALLRSL